MSIGQPQRLPKGQTYSRTVLTGGGFGRDTTVLYISRRDIAAGVDDLRRDKYLYNIWFQQLRILGVMDRRVCHGLTRCFNCAVFEQVLAMHIHNSWFQQLRILWVWTIELSWADAMLYLSCVRTSLGYESACRLSASEIQEQQSRSFCKRNTRAAVTKLPVICAEDSSLAPSVPQQAK